MTVIIYEESNEIPIKVFGESTHHIEKVTLENAIYLVEEIGWNEYGLGLELLEIQKEQWFAGEANFQAYVENVLGIKYDEAALLSQMHMKIMELDFSPDKIFDVTWRKLKVMHWVLTKKNADHWIAPAKKNTCTGLAQLVQAELGKPAEE